MLSDNNYSYGITEQTNSIKRLADFPIDESSVFNTYNEAEEYAKNDLTAYDTQIIGIKESGELYQVKNKSLVPLQSKSISDLTNCFGRWNITLLNNSKQAKFNLDIFYPLDVDSYQLFKDDISLNSVTDFDDDCFVDTSIFNEKNLNIKLCQHANDTLYEVIRLRMSTINNNGKIIYGVLIKD